jgi:hypothetical protein
MYTSLPPAAGWTDAVSGFPSKVYSFFALNIITTWTADSLTDVEVKNTDGKKCWRPKRGKKKCRMGQSMNEKRQLGQSEKDQKRWPGQNVKK